MAGAHLAALVSGGAASVVRGLEPGRHDQVDEGALAMSGFTCPVCGAVSHNPQDVEHGYCARCHDWTGGPPLPPGYPAELRRELSGPRYWVLDENNNPAPAGVMGWGQQRESGGHLVELTEFHVAGQTEPVVVSTVFLGMDHGFGFGARPVLFETLVRPGDALQEQYCSWDEAVAGHKAIVAQLMARYVVVGEDR